VIDKILFKIKNRSIFPILFFGAGFAFFIIGISLKPYSGVVPFFELIGIGGLLVFWGTSIGLILSNGLHLSKSVTASALLQYYTIVCLTLLSFWSLCGHFFIDQSLFHDVASYYSLFHDNLQSLNYFSEPAWWFPQNQFGFPGYFYSFLGPSNGFSPISVTLGCVFWVLGRAGIIVTNIFPVYIWYFGAIVPFLFSLSLWMLARQILRSSAAIIFVCIISAFSPGVILNLGDPGLFEATIYGVFFVGAYLKFIRVPEKNNYLVLVLAAMFLSVTLNFTFLIWNALFITAFFLLLLFPINSFFQAQKAFKSVSLRHWLVVFVLLCVCVSPPLITLSQQGEIIRTTLAETANRYTFMSRGIGNPLLVLLSGTPGAGWKGNEQFLIPSVLSSGYHAYNYLGMLVIPMAIWGFLFSKSYWRIRLFVLFIFYFSIVILQNHSPLFATILSLHTPLTAVSHFNDVTFRVGGFMLLLLAAGLGIDLLQTSRSLNWVLIAAVAFSILFSGTMLLFLSHNDMIILGFVFGFLFLMGLSFLIVLVWLRNTPQTDFNWQIFMGFLLLLTLVDVSTISHLHVRTVMFPTISDLIANRIDMDEQRSDKIGILNDRANGQANTTLSTTSFLSLKKKSLPIGELPRYALFHQGHVSNVISISDFDNAISGLSLALSQKAEEREPFRSFLNKSLVEKIGTIGKIIPKGRRYNSFQLVTQTQNPVLLFIRDAYHPYWKATINGKETEIIRALGNFKAIVIPKGESIISFSFRPPNIAISLFIAYFCIVLIVALWGREVYTQSTKLKHT
jgi:hypothetical protein